MMNFGTTRLRTSVAWATSPCLSRRAHGLVARATWVGTLALLTFAATAAAEEGITLFPHTFALDGPAAHHGLVVERTRDGQFMGQIPDAGLMTSDDHVVRIEQGIAIPVGNGKALIKAKDGDNAAVAE